MVEELAAGFFRGLLVLLRAIARILWEILRETGGDLALRAIVWLCARLLQAIGLFLQFLVRVLHDLYRLLFRPARPFGYTSALVHAAAICVLMTIGFGIGATASVLYHADWHSPNTLASYEVER